jgi:hypothetical protein
MAITVAATGSSTLVSSQSPSVTFSSYTPATNDVVYFFTVCGVAAQGINAVAGWVNPLGGTTIVASDAHTVFCAYHLVTSGEASAVTTTYTITNWLTAARGGTTVAIVLRGVDSTTPVDAVASTFDSANTATPSILPALVGTDLSTNSLVVGAVGRDGVGGTWTTPAGWTFRTNATGDSGSPGSALSTLSPRRAPHVAATNITPSAGDEYASVTIAFTAAAAASPPVLKTYAYSVAIQRSATF